MLLSVVLSLLLFSQFLRSQETDKNGISLYEKMEEMERQLLRPNGLETWVSPCSSFPKGDKGDQTSAEWVRIVFHDMVTANISAGTGSVIFLGSELRFINKQVVVLTHRSALNRIEQKTLGRVL